MIAKLLTFGIALIMFAIFFVQIFLGYIITGRTSTQTRIYMSEDPLKFWIVAAIPFFIGVFFLVLGLFSVLKKQTNQG